MCSPQKRFLLIVPLKATRDSQRFWFWLRSVHRTTESRYDAHHGVFWKIWVTWLRGMHHREIAIVKCWIKTDTLQVIDSAVWFTPVWLLVWCRLRSFFIYFFSWLRDVMHTAKSDSWVWCTPLSLTPRYDAHRRAWLCSMMHTAELFKNLNISMKSKPNSKILYPVYQGPRWVQIVENK